MQLHQQHDEIERLGVQVLVVTFEAGAVVENYVRETQLQWPILLDEELMLYSAYGMERGTVWDVWGPASWRIYGKLLLRGRRLKAPTGDVHQLGGDVLIDPQQVVRLHHVGRGPADRPSVDSLLDVVRQETN